MNALDTFIEIWSDTILLDDLGPKLTCVECNALADLLKENGHEHSAEILLESHSAADEPGDDPLHLARLTTTLPSDTDAD